MGQNIFNLALRFILEIIALIAIGYWGWVQHQGVLRYALVISLPVIAAVLWAIFRVSGEPNSGPPIVAVPGPVRLLLEIAFFGFAVWSLFNTGITGGAWLLGGILLFHYLISYDRIWWLLRN
jgi:hypothetical protein